MIGDIQCIHHFFHGTSLFLWRTDNDIERKQGKQQKVGCATNEGNSNGLLFHMTQPGKDLTYARP